VGVSQAVQFLIGGDHLGGDPGSFRPVGAAANDAGKVAVDRDNKSALAKRAGQPARDVEAVQLEDRPRIGRPPADRIAFVIPGKDAAEIGRQQDVRPQVAADAHQAVGVGPFGIVKR
jgi:hypothetical protein